MVKNQQRQVSSFYERLFSEGFFVFDDEEPYFQEKVLQVIWNEQILKKPLFCEAGKCIEIIHHGIWNLEGGPDFHDAVISIDGKIQKGDVEIHLAPKDWTSHHHQINSDYNNVILHVIWQNPSKYKEFPNGVALFNVQNFLSIPIQQVLIRLDLARYPYSMMVKSRKESSWFEHLENDCLMNLFQSLGIARILEKSQKFTENIEKYGLEKSVYRALFDVMGYKNNRKAFGQLVSLVPLSDLATYPEETAIAVLFGAAGLLPDPSKTNIEPGYLKWSHTMWSKWWPKRNEYRTLDWKKSKSRPYNSPERRVLAAHLVLRKNDYKLGQKLVQTLLNCSDARKCLNEITEIFTLDVDPKFLKFANFSKSLKKPIALLGRNRIHDLIINFVIPLFFAYCMYKNNPSQCNKGKEILLKIPRLQDNRKFKEAAQLFFNPPSRAIDVIKNACGQQGLLNFYKNIICT